jgi:TatA/E family protein of Tat protein translocase
MLSLPHLVIVFIVALVVFGPEKLPELARNLGKWTAEFRRMTGEFKGTFETHMRDLEREANERKAAVSPAPVATAAQPSPPAMAAPDSSNDSAEAEHSIGGAVDAAASAGEGAGPVVRPAEGIVPTAAPRLVPEAPVETPQNFEGDAAAAAPGHATNRTEASEHASNMTDAPEHASGATDAPEHASGTTDASWGHSPEPVTDGQHHTE